jgi:hypothetical protein
MTKALTAAGGGHDHQPERGSVKIPAPGQAGGEHAAIAFGYHPLAERKCQPPVLQSMRPVQIHRHGIRRFQIGSLHLSQYHAIDERVIRCSDLLQGGNPGRDGT